jgi:uncharacterized protein YjbI with pentapeptide repeats
VSSARLRASPKPPRRSQFNRCRLSGLVAAGTKAQDVESTDCKLADANFRASSWERCRWVESEMAGADFYAAKLTSCGFLSSDLSRIELSKASCDRIALHRSKLDDLRGALFLRGCVIGSDQVVSLARSVLAALDILVDDGVDDLTDR